MMVHVIPANQWSLKQKSVFKLVLLWNIEKTEFEWLKKGQSCEGQLTEGGAWAEGEGQPM